MNENEVAKDKRQIWGEISSFHKLGCQTRKVGIFCKKFRRRADFENENVFLKIEVQRSYLKSRLRDQELLKIVTLHVSSFP